MTNDGNPALLFNHTYDLEGRQIAVSGATAPTPPYRQQVLADAPAGYWRLGEAAGNDVAADSSGNGLNGSYRSPNVVRGDPGALQASGDSDTSARFTGQNYSYVSVPSSPSPTRLTIEAWVKPFDASGGPEGVEEFVSKFDNNTQLFWYLRQSRTTFQFQVAAQAPTVTYAPATFPVNQWVHLVGTFDGTTERLYANGAEVANAAWTGNAASTPGTLTFGALWVDGPQQYNGDLDEVAIYTTALSATRILAHYQAGTTSSAGGQLSRTAGFVYNGDGLLVARRANGTTIAHYAAGGSFEKDPSTGAYKKYYHLGGKLVAEREVPSGGTSATVGTLHYLHQDHLGSTSLQTTASGQYEGHQFRAPFGQPWASGGSLATDLQYTGQRSYESGAAPLGSLLDYGARSYSPVLGKFLQADTIVPGAGDPQSLNRYAYTKGNPLKYVDPTGHSSCEEVNDCGNDWNPQQYPTGYSTGGPVQQTCEDINNCLNNDWDPAKYPSGYSTGGPHQNTCEETNDAPCGGGGSVASPVGLGGVCHAPDSHCDTGLVNPEADPGEGGGGGVIVTPDASAALAAGGTAVTVVEVGVDLGEGARRVASELGRTLRSSTDGAARSAAARKLVSYGKATRFAEHELFKALGSVAIGVDLILTYDENRAHGQSPAEAGTRAALSVGGGLAGSGLAVTGAVAIVPETAGVSIVVIPVAAVAGDMVGRRFGDKLGDVIFMIVRD